MNSERLFDTDAWLREREDMLRRDPGFLKQCAARGIKPTDVGLVYTPTAGEPFPHEWLEPGPMKERLRREWLAKTSS